MLHRVVLADDHPVVREGLCRLLRDSSEIEVVGQAGDGHEALRLARTLLPDLLVVDLSMPGLDGIELTKVVADELPRVKVVGLTMHASEEYAIRLLRAGARGFALVKRSVYYLSITAALALAYLGFLGMVNLALRRSAFAASPVFPLAFTLIVVLLINPLKDLVQGAVDRVFFRVRYNPRQVLNSASAALTSTLRLEDVVSFIWDTIGATMGVRSGGIYLRAADGGEYVPAHAGSATASISAAIP